MGHHGPQSVLQISWKVAHVSHSSIVSYPKSCLLSAVLVRWLHRLLERLSRDLPSGSITQPAARILLMWRDAQEEDEIVGWFMFNYSGRQSPSAKSASAAREGLSE